MIIMVFIKYNIIEIISSIKEDNTSLTLES
jgi:hypothetical protein